MKLLTEVSQNVKVQSDDDHIFVEGIFSSAENKNINGRIYKKSTLQREVDKLMEKVDNKCLWGELSHPQCIYGDTEILTNEGWKEIQNISNNEIVATLNPNNRNIEYHQIKQKVILPFVGNMINFSGRQINMSFTPNHRHLLFNRYDTPYFATSEEIYKPETLKIRKSYIPKTGTWYSTNDNSDYYTLKGVDENELSYYRNKDVYSSDSIIDMKVFAGFLGLYLAEGHLSKGRNEKNTICITQNIGEKAELIRSLLKEFPDEMTWDERTYNDKITFSLTDIRLAKVLQPLGNCYDKYIPTEFKSLSVDCLEEMLYWFGIGDGRGFLNDDKLKDIFSTSEKLIDDFHEIVFKCGLSAKKTVEICEQDYIFADRIIKSENKQPLYFLRILTTKGIYPDNRFMKITEEYYEGNVYCVQVKNENFYVRNNNSVSFFTGNCPEVSPDRISHLIEKLEWQGNDLVGKAKIIDTPMGKIAKTLLKEGRIGISSRGLGTVNETDSYVNDDYFMITWDLVIDPSNQPSWINAVTESRDFDVPWIVTPKKEEVTPEIMEEQKLSIEEARKEYTRKIWQVIEKIEKSL